MIQITVTELDNGKTLIELREPLDGAILDRQIMPISWRETTAFAVNFYGYRAEILPSNHHERTTDVTTTAEG